MTPPILRIQKFTRVNRHELSLRGLTNARYYYFHIVAANGEIIAQSESYRSARARNKTVSLLLAAKMEEEK